MTAKELTNEDRKDLKDMTCVNPDIVKAVREEDYRAIVQQMIDNKITVSYIQYLEVAQIAKDRGWRVPSYTIEGVRNPFTDLSYFAQEILHHKIPSYIKNLIDTTS